MLKLLVTAFVCFNFLSAQAAENKTGSVTIPIEEYIQLREAKKGPELTSVENVFFDGVFGKSMTMTVSGSANGAPKPVDILQLTDAFGVKDCAGTNAMLSGNDNRLNVVPLQAGRFKITCHVQVRNWAQVEFSVDNALFAGARLSGGEALVRVDGSSQVITLVRPSAPTEDTKAPVAIVARYRVAVLPEESRFQYEFQISNPGRTLRRMTLPKANGEIFSQIRSTIQHQEGREGLNLELQPGENVIRAEGRFAGNSFTPPVEGQSFLLVENSPTLQLTIESASRRISPKDAGIPPHFAGARAYLISKNQKISWEARQLDVFSALGYSVQSANYLYYVPRQGAPIIEATFQMNNQGTPEVALDIPGQVTYLEIGGEPQVLSRDKDGKLLLQLPNGEQSVLIQYLSKAEHGSLLAFPSEPLARPAAVLSNVNMALSLDPRWSMTFGRSLFEINSDLSFMDLMWAALITMLGFWAVRDVGLGRRDRALFLGALFIALAAAPWLFPWALAVLGLYLCFQQRAKLLKHWPRSNLSRGFAVAGIVILGLWLCVSILLNRRGEPVSRFASEQIYNKVEGGFGGSMQQRKAAPPTSQPEAMMDTMGAEVGLAAGGGGSLPEGQRDYQGVPARLSIPSGRIVTFTQGVIDTKTPVKIGAILVNRAFNAFFMLLSALSIAHVLYHNRRKFKDSARI